MFPICAEFYNEEPYTGKPVMERGKKMEIIF